MDPEEVGRIGLEHPGEDRLLDLVLGFLSPSEESVCLAHMRRCGDCEAQARTLASEHARFRSKIHADLALDGPAIEGVATDPGAVVLDRATHPARRRRPFLAKPFWVIPIATAAAVILVLVQHTGKNESTQVEPVWLVNPSSIIVTNRDPALPVLDPDLRAGFEAYARRDLSAAIQSLGRARTDGDMELLRRVYLGSALARKGRSREALSVLRALRAEEIPGVLRNEVRWTLFVALLNAGETASAESLLTVLGKEPGEIGDRARQRLAVP